MKRFSVIAVLIFALVVLWLAKCEPVDSCRDTGGAWDHVHGHCIRDPSGD